MVETIPASIAGCKILLVRECSLFGNGADPHNESVTFCVTVNLFLNNSIYLPSYGRTVRVPLLKGVAILISPIPAICTERAVGEFDDKLERAAHTFDVATQRRDEEVATLFHLGHRGLADVECLGDFDLGEVPCLAEFPEGSCTPLAGGRYSASIRARLSADSPFILSRTVVAIGLSFHRREMAIEALVGFGAE